MSGKDTDIIQGNFQPRLYKVLSLLKKNGSMPNSFGLEMMRAVVLSVLPQILCDVNFIMFLCNSEIRVHKKPSIRGYTVERDNEPIWELSTGWCD